MKSSCENCQHWATKGWYPEEGWGVCLLGRSEVGIPKNPDTLAYASDAESYVATLNTKAEFLCCQYQEKP